MSIRLNKALRELNIGLQTAVEFLESKQNLGEVKADLNFKLNDEQYKALESQFKQDAEVRSQAEKMISQKKPKDKKRAPEQNDANAEKPVKADGPQKFTPLGKIDLDSIGKKPSAKSAAPQEHKEAPKKEAAAVSHEPAKSTPKVEKPAAQSQTVAASKETPKEAPKVEAKPEKKVEAPKAEPKKTQYWVQVAAYSNKKGAEGARTILDENKIPSDIFTYRDNNDKLYYRVRVGPYTTKSEAEYWRTKIVKIKEIDNANDSYVTSTVN